MKKENVNSVRIFAKDLKTNNIVTIGVCNCQNYSTLEIINFIEAKRYEVLSIETADCEVMFQMED